MIDQLLHRWLRVPYTLNIRYLQKPKRPRATLLFIHGIGNNGDAWQHVIEKLPNDLRIITIDLLGFGDSKRPNWAVYNAKTQARAVLATYLKLRIATPVIVVGHSLGSLVAIEMAKRYPLIIKSLILCSPPLYDTANAKRRLPRSDTVLRGLYKAAQRRPQDFMKLSALALKYNLINKSFSVDEKNIDAYMAALESMIINQTSYEDAFTLKTPTLILRGTLDPFVVKRNIQRLTKGNPFVTTKTIIAGHEIMGRFVPAVVQAIESQLQPTQKSDIKKK